MSIIVGISANFHDSACCLMREGVLVAAAQEERFSRSKHDPSFPRKAFLYCMRQAGVTIGDIDCLAYYETPVKKLARQLWMRSADLSEETIAGLWWRSQQPF